MSTKSLWDKDIEGITYKDIEDFISLNLPEDQRPKEGIQLDYKTNTPNELGKTVTAFANTYGGLCILGVAEKNNIPIKIVGIENPRGSDIKTQIANRIRSNVYPPPMIRIGVVPFQDEDRSIVVIKIEEGEESPYVWQHDGKEEIYLRYIDTCRMASRSEIEALFKKKAELQEGNTKKNKLVSPSVYIPEEGDKLTNYSQSFYCMPLGNVTLTMDKKDEDEMYKLVISNLKRLSYETGDKSAQPFIPNSSDCSYCDGSDGSIRINIGFSKNGEIGLATSLYSAALDKCVWNVIVRYARNFLTIAEKFYKKYNYYGKIELTYKIFTKELSIIDEEMSRRDLKRDTFGRLN